MYRVLAIADTHCNSRLAPWPEGYELSKGGEWQPSRFQRWLNHCFETMRIEVKERGTIDAVVLVGDAIEGVHPRNSALVSTRRDDMVGAAVELLAPIRELSQHFYMIQGSAWHAGQGSEDEAAVAMQLDATPCTETSERVWGDLLLDMGGVVGHFAHHIGCTTNPMYEATALLREIYVVRAELDKEWGVLRPDVRLVVRGHRHRLMVVSKDEWHGLCLPGWQFKTDFSYRVAPASISEIGYAVIECQDGKIVIDTHKFHLPMPHVERGTNNAGTAA